MPGFTRSPGGLAPNDTGRRTLMLNKHEEGNSAGGGAGGPRRRAPALTNLNLPAFLITVFLLSAAVAAAYEAVKSLLFTTITIWQSHELTIGFIALSSTVVFYFARRAQHSLEWKGQRAALVVAQDVTERRQAELGLRRSERQVGSILENMQDAYIQSSLEGRILLVSPSAPALYGYDSVEEMMAVPAASLYFSPQLRQECLEALRVSGRISDRVGQGRKKDGSAFWVSMSMHFMYGDAGRVVGYEAIVRDISARKQAEEALRQSEEKFRSLVANIPDVTWTVDSRFHFVFVSKNIEKITGYTADEVYRKGARLFLEVLHPDDLARTRAGIEALLARGEPYDGELRVRRKDGQWIWVRSRAVAAYEKNGVRYVDGLFSDITERKEMEQALAQERDLLHALMDNIPDYIYFKDRESRFIRTNRAHAKLFRLGDPAEAIGKTDFDFFAGEHAQQAYDDEQEVIRTGTPIHAKEEKETWPDGHISWVSTTKMPLRDAAGNVVGTFGVSRDISQQKRTELALRVSEERYRLLFERNVAGIFRSTVNGRLLECNQAWADMLGFESRQEALAHQAADFYFSGDDRARFIEKLTAQRRLSDFEMRLRRKDGTPLWVTANVSPLVQDADGAQVIESTIVDITARKQAEEAQAFLASIVESSNDAIVGKTPDGTIVSWNKGAESLYGYSADEAIGKPFSLLVPADRATEAEQILERIKAGETTSNLETSRLRKDGTAVEVSVTYSPIRNSAGEVTGSATIAHDITARKWNERELAYERTLFQALMDNIPDTIYFQDTACRFIRVNKAQARMLGISDPNEAVGRTDFDFFPADFAQECYDSEQKLLQSGQPIIDAVQELTRPDGQVQWLSSTEVPIRDGEGKVLGLVGISRDITDRKRAQEQMRLLTTALQSAANGVTITDRTGRILWVNPAFTRLTGYSAAEVVGQNPRVLKSGSQDGAFYQGMWATILAGSVWQGELINRRKDGSVYTEEMTITPVRDATQAVSHFIAIKSDVSERKLAQEKLRLAEESYRSLVLNIPDVVWTQDSNGRVTFVSPKIETVSGYSVDEIRQQGARLFLDSIHPDDLRKVSDALKSLFEKGREYNVECRFRRKNGEWIWVRDRAVATYERNGVRFADGLFSDVTEHKRMGVELQQAQKLEAVGRLASGIAHEINTPIQFVGDNTRFLQDSFGGLEMLLKKYHDLREAASASAVTANLIEEVKRAEKESDCEYLLEEIPKALSQTLDGVNRVATIVRAMKDFAHPDRTEKAAADLNRALLSTLTVARNELKYVADVETEFGELPLVVCNVGDLNQVFLNILVNAAHAIAEKVKEAGTKGQIRVRTAREDGSALIAISDTGCGIPEVNRARVFDPFFTTKEVGRGTGQGLAIARSVVVERHKGTLTFDSEVGKGTTFYIRIPLGPVECVKDKGEA